MEPLPDYGPMPDYGPIYTETNFDRFPVEPFNTVSNFLFLATAIYWILRIRKQTNLQFKNFLKLGLPLLLVGYVGGSIYHATRSHYGWMLMDVLPIYFLGLLTAIYHWKLVGVSLWKMALTIIGLLVIPMAMLSMLAPDAYDSSNTPTLGYSILVLTVILPLFIDQQRRQWKEIKPMLVPLILIVIALFFRALDSSQFVRTQVPIGTHWLWHSFGAATCHFMLRFMEKRALDQN